VRKRKECGCDNCIFREEIREAIKKKKKIGKITPKPKPPRVKIKRTE